MADPTPFPIDEQESGSYLATILDDLGAYVPGSALLELKLSLYVIRSDGSIAYVNSRTHQNVLNTQNVTVYDTLQALPDGRTYNLRWAIQPEDTTLVEAIPYERHLFLFEWKWAQGQGKQEGVLIVKNLTVVT